MTRGPAPLRRLANEWAMAACILRTSDTPLLLYLDRARLLRKDYLARAKTGEAMRITPGQGEWFTFFECVLRRDYFQLASLKPGDAVVDIGANIGCFSIAAAYLVGATGSVLACEPNVAVATRIHQNAATNDLTNIKVMSSAVSGARGRAALCLPGKSVFASIEPSVVARNAASGHSTIDVGVVGINDIIRQVGHPIALLKIDCEGAEYDIIASLQSDVASSVHAIILEVHDVPGHDPIEILSRLEHLGYRVQSRGPLMGAVRVSFDDATVQRH